MKSYLKFSLMFMAAAMQALEICLPIHHGLVNRGLVKCVKIL